MTLTYGTRREPEDGSLRVKDWQDFAKRLRKRCGRFRFFHCGEYGEENFRPHLHAVVFGLDFTGDREYFKTVRGNPLYTSKCLDETWGLGFATIGSVSFESAAYVARYSMKKVHDESSEERFLRVDEETGESFRIRPEYVTMSRRPGIGSKWFEQFSSEVFPADEVVYEGKRFRPPRFYDLKINESDLLDLKAKRRLSVKSRSLDLTEERLRVREKVAAVRVSGLHRKI